MEVIELEREAFLRNRPKELKGLNPNGKVPCFVDEGKGGEDIFVLQSKLKSYCYFFLL